MTYDMNIEQIKSFLARFYEGQTTPEEERLLADFFRREDVPEDLQQDKQLFLLFVQASDQEMPQDIAEEITAFVNNLGQTKIQPLIPEDKQRKGVIFRLKTPPKMWYRVAATVAILLAIGGGMFVHQQRTLATDPFRDTCSTPEEAAAHSEDRWWGMQGGTGTRAHLSSGEAKCWVDRSSRRNDSHWLFRQMLGHRL